MYAAFFQQLNLVHDFMCKSVLLPSLHLFPMWTFSHFCWEAFNLTLLDWILTATCHLLLWDFYCFSLSFIYLSIYLSVYMFIYFKEHLICLSYQQRSTSFTNKEEFSFKEILKLKINCAPLQSIYNSVYKAFWKSGCYQIHLNDFTCLHKRMNGACTSLKAVSPRQERSFPLFTILFSLIVIYY